MHLLVIEDERALCETIVRDLRRLAYSVDFCHDGEEALELLYTEHYDLVLLDLNLPGKDGMTVLRTLRQTDHETRVLILSARSGVEDKVAGLDAGANDYLAKPFHLQVLSAKVQAMLRRAYDFAGTAHLLSCGGAVLNVSDGTLTANGQKVELTRNEFKILQLLLEHRGEIVSREAIMTRLWESDSFVDENTLTVNVARLRRKLESAGLTDFIRTRKGAGYLVEG